MATALSLTKLIEEYEAQKAVVEDLEARKKEVKAEIDRLEKQVLDQMADMADAADVALTEIKIMVGNKNYSASMKQNFSFLAEDRPVVFEGLRMGGLGWLIQETVNTQSFNKEMRDQAAENGGALPAELAALPIKKYEKPTLSGRAAGRRKSK